jgi:hypothetical protein
MNHRGFPEVVVPQTDIWPVIHHRGWDLLAPPRRALYRMP